MLLHDRLLQCSAKFLKFVQHKIHCKSVFIPPVYEVYRGYIVFAFSVRMFVCLSVSFFSVKDFSETT